MKPDDWHQIQRLHAAALGKDPGEREAFLNEACRNDPELRAQVDALLSGVTQDLSRNLTQTFSAEPAPAAELEAETHLGPYRILRILGAGGMGVVYAAHDERLDRAVALKTLRRAAQDTAARHRFAREARVAAAINHPNICQLYDIGEDHGTMYLVMELLEGESLETRLRRGPLETPAAIQNMLEILAGVDVLHRRGLVHRDLKPSNIFLTPHGLKLLDFGLTRQLLAGEDASEAPITLVGSIAGTPNYMAPEQAEGRELDARADLFAAGAILFEMITGRRAFAGASTVTVLTAVLHDAPGSTGSSADPVLHKALAKDRERRYPSASAMAQDLREALMRPQAVERPAARGVTRLIVLPFRMLRPDPDIDFLAFSLPDAITNSLSGLTSLVVRSSLAAAKYGPSADPARVAQEAEVDAVLSGTLLRSGDQLRVATQLSEAPGGAVLWSETSQFSLQDVFQLQDELVRRVVAALAVPLTARETQLLKHDVPASAAAYEFYLRANRLSTDWQQTILARDLYLKCLELDPGYAPAWARVGRCHRLIAKYGGEDEDFARAERSFQRALELNPELSLAHHLYAHLEADLGRAPDAMVRLLGRTRANGNDPDLYAGLVYVCRFCGLLEASMAAHSRARRLDPLIPTSVTQSYFMAGDYQAALDTSAGDIGYIDALSLSMLGRDRDALELLRQREPTRHQHALIRWFLVALRALLEGDRAACVEASEQGLAVVRRGGEEVYYIARQLARAGAPERAAAALDRALEYGFFCYPALARDPWLDPLRTIPRFVRVLEETEARHRRAQALYREAGGVEILGTV